MFMAILTMVAFQPPAPPPWHKMVPVAESTRTGFQILEGCQVEVVAEGPALQPARELVFQVDGTLACREKSPSGVDRFRMWTRGAGSRWIPDTGLMAMPPLRLSNPPLRNGWGTTVTFRVDPSRGLGRNEPIVGTMVLGDRFPPVLQGWWITAHPDRAALVAYRPVRDGLGWAMADAMDLLVAQYGDMAIEQVVEGPDGAIYALDGRLSQGTQGTKAGKRILKITWAGAGEDAPAIPSHPLARQAALAQATPAELVAALRGDDALIRFAAIDVIAPRVSGMREALVAVLKDPEASGDARLAALRLLDSQWKEDLTAPVTDMLELAGEELRMGAAESLARHALPNDPVCAGVLLKTLGDGDAGVRLAVARTLTKLRIDGAADAIVNLLTLEDSATPELRAGLISALQGLGSTAMDRLLASAESGVRRQADRAVAVASGCANTALVESMPQWLDNPNLMSDQRGQLLEGALAGPVASDAVALKILTWLVDHPDENAETRAAGLKYVARTGLIKREQGLAWLRSLVKESDGAVLAAVATVCGQLKLPELMPFVLGLARDGSAPRSARAAAIMVLEQSRHAQAGELAKQFLDDISVKDAASLLLAGSVWAHLYDADPAAAAVAAEKIVPQISDLKLVRTILTKPWADKAIAQRLAARAPLNKLQDSDLASMLDDPALHAVRPVLLGHWLKRHSASLATKSPVWSDAERGWALFGLDSHRCARCHQTGEAPDLAGPRASTVLKGRSRDAAINALLHPSASFEPRYGALSLRLKNGQEIIGLPKAEVDGRVTVIGPDGLSRDLMANTIVGREPARRSLMPDDCVAEMPRADVAALVALVESGIPAGQLVPRNARQRTVEASGVAELLVSDLGDKPLEGAGEITDKSPNGFLLEGDISVQQGSTMRLIVQGAVVQRTWVAGKLQPDTHPMVAMGVNRVTVWLIPTSGPIRWQLASFPKVGN